MEVAKKPTFTFFYHMHCLGSLAARFCIEIGKQAHPDAKANIKQIEVELTENGKLPVEYLKANISGTVSIDITAHRT